MLKLRFDKVAAWLTGCHLAELAVVGCYCPTQIVESSFVVAVLVIVVP